MKSNITLTEQLEVLIAKVMNGELQECHLKELENLDLNELELSIVNLLKLCVEREVWYKDKISNLVKTVERRSEELDQQMIVNFHNSKVTAMGDIVDGIAHEINNPLTTMKMLVSSALREIDKQVFEPEVITEKLVKINIMIDRIAKIVKGLRTFSQEGSNDSFVSVNLKNLIEDSIYLCDDNIRSKEISLITYYDSDEIVLECKRTQLSQAFLNILNNAIEAIEKLEDKWIEIQVKADEKWAYITVTDSGIGIAKEIQLKIFDPFFTTKEPGKNVGLGLNVALGIIKDHDGEIILSQAEKNTQFIIKLPLKRSS